MPSSLLKLSSFITFFYIALLLSSPNENVEAAETCRRLSGKFAGNCFGSGHCEETCQREGAVSGNCKAQGSLSYACFCYENF